MYFYFKLRLTLGKNFLHIEYCVSVVGICDRFIRFCSNQNKAFPGFVVLNLGNKAVSRICFKTALSRKKSILASKNLFGRSAHIGECLVKS